MLESNDLNLWKFISVVTMCVDWIVFFTVLYLISNRKISKIKYLYRALLVTIFMGYLDISNIFSNIKIILCMIIGVLFYRLSYEEKIYKCIMVNLLFWLGLMITEAIAIGIVLMINKLENIHLLLDSNIYKLEGIIISKAILVVELILFKYFGLVLEFKPKDLLLVGIPILSNIVSLLLIFRYDLNKNIENSVHIIILLFAISLIVLSSITLLIVIGKIVQDNKFKLEYELIDERIKTNHKSYENINEIHDKIRYIYHDLKNHMICIKSYNSRDEIISYINNLEFQMNDFEYLKNTGNKTLDIILSEKKYTCKKYNIDFEDYINISKLEFLKDIDICAIFANALDNAIEACINIDKDIQKKIEVKVTYINEFAILKFKNTKSNEIKFIDQRIQTTKDYKKIHGIGLASIKYIISKYEGELIVNYSDDEFILKIMIPIRQ